MSDAIPPMVYRWSGEAMVPRHARVADRHFVIGADYILVEHHERSSASHAHFFACVKSAWASLPEDDAERFPTPEHLRKYALIQAGFRDERTIACASRAEALRLAAFIKPMDEFAVVVTSGACVRVYTAKSQSYRSMDRKTFQASKEAAMEVLASMLNVEPAALASAA